MVKKKLEDSLKIIIPSGMATPVPPLGPALGQKKVNIMEFCKAFNAIDNGPHVPKGTPVPVLVHIYKDKSFNIVVGKPTVSYLIMQALSIKKGSPQSGRSFCGTLSYASMKKIAEIKASDLNSYNLDAAMRIIAGSARSMGVEIEDST